MKKRYSFLSVLMAAFLMFSGCASTSAEPSAQTPEPAEEITLEQVNDYLNDSSGLGEGGIGNVVAIIPHEHIDGPKNETPFYAFVTFKYKARDYIKYQVSYLSCTCREASVNMWQTMYVELSLPASKNPAEAQVKYISFDKDSTGHYTGGHWGDSDPIPSGQTYEMFKTQYIPFFVKKDAAYLNELSVVDDINLTDYQAGDGRGELTLDAFSGASVSTNNIIRILNAIMDYHATDSYFTAE